MTLQHAIRIFTHHHSRLCHLGSPEGVAGRPLLHLCRRPQRATRHDTRCLVSPQDAFSVTTVAVMPIYSLMVACPRRPLTQQLMKSEVFFAAAAALYAVLLYMWAPLPALWSIVKEAWVGGSFPSMAAFAACFHNGQLTALAWLHLVLLDLFQARWVYLDGLKRQVQTAHSLVLCFMVGPLGLLSHLVTTLLTRNLQRSSGLDDACT